MRRRLMSAILSIAMIVSLFTVTFVSPVGASAETAATTTYVNDRAALKDAIRTLYSKGPELAADLWSAYLLPYGIITDADWHDAVAKDYYTIVKTRQDLDLSLGANSLTKYFVKDTARFLNIFGADKTILAGEIAWIKTPVAPQTAEELIVENIEAVIRYACAVYYFAQNEDDANVDPSFNEGRNAVVKEATSLVNAVIAGLKAEILDNDNKPSEYAKDFMGVDYKGFLSAAYKYHPSLGVNPFYNIANEYNSAVNPWAAYYNDGYYGAIGATPVRWYTFDEIRANADWNKLLVAFEFELRKIHTATGNGVLYVDYINGDKANFNGSFDALCKAILGSATLTGNKLDMTKEIKAYLKLKKVIDIYNLYIKDLYNNIYTATDLKLMTDVLMASRFVEFVNDEAYKVLALKYADIEGLADSIAAEIAAVAPRAEQVLDSASLTAGVKAVKEAKALVASYPETDGNKGVRNALIAAAADLENMLPVASNGKVTINVAKDTYKMKDVYAVEIGNDKFSVTFTPNYFAFIKYKALLDASISAFYANVNAYSIDTNINSSRDNLKAILNKYGYLYGIVGTVVDNNQFIHPSALSEEYYDLLSDYGDIGYPDRVVTCIYEKVVGYAYSRTLLNFDAAIDNVYYFMDIYDDAIDSYESDNPPYDDGIYTDWETGTITVKNGYDAAAASVKDALAFLTKDLTVYINTVRYNLNRIGELFDLDNTSNPFELFAINPANLSPAADGVTVAFEGNYPTDYLDKFVTAANNLKKILIDTIDDGDPTTVDYDRATTTKLIAAEKAFIAATKALLTDLGDARLDAYLADVQKASKVNYGLPALDYNAIELKFFNAGMDPAYYILTNTPRNYEYFAFTLKSVAAWNAPVNYYAFDSNAAISRFELNFLNAFNAALAISTDASGYARDAAAKASTLLKNGYSLKQAIVINSGEIRTLNIGTDMPLWYALKLLSDIQGIPAMLSANSVGVIAAAKAAAGGLNELLDKAAALNVYDYIVGENKDYDKVWEAFMNAYNAGVKVSYDKTVPLADIDAAVKALSEKMAALESIKRPEGGEVITVDDFKAAIAKAEATVARYDLAEDLEVVNTLKEVINAANKLLTYNISVVTAGELKTEIAKLNDAVKAVLDVIYVGDALKADVEAEAAGVDANAYTEASYKAFKDAVDAALAIAAKEDSKVSESKAALEAVKAAKAALATKPVVVESDTHKEAVATYEKAVSDYAALTGYSEESMANLKTAIDDLKAGIDAGSSDAQLIDLIVKLRLANAALIVSAPETLDD